jgi:transcriptional regulator with XRE-family HTH domain
MSREILFREIGERIHQVRKETGLSQAKFAKSLGLKGSGWISELEAGIKKPSDVLLIAIKALYKINPEWITTGRGNKYIFDEHGYPHKEVRVVNEAGAPGRGEILDTVIQILDSGDQGIISALTKNIQEFARAVDTRRRLEEHELALTDVRQELARVRNELDTIKKSFSGGGQDTKGTEEGV